MSRLFTLKAALLVVASTFLLKEPLQNSRHAGMVRIGMGY